MALLTPRQMSQQRKGNEALPGIGLVLKSIREKAGLSPRALDRMANIGESVIGLVEKGGRSCNTRTLAAWFAACGYDLAIVLEKGIGGAAGAPDEKKNKVGRPSTKTKIPIPELNWEDDGEGGKVAVEKIGKEWPATWTYRVKNGHWSLGNKSNPEAASGIGVDDLHGQELIDDWRRENMAKLYKA
jgi:hypothetical protein